jgi:hypothetical protein
MQGRCEVQRRSPVSLCMLGRLHDHQHIIPLNPLLIRKQLVLIFGKLYTQHDKIMHGCHCHLIGLRNPCLSTTLPFCSQCSGMSSPWILNEPKAPGSDARSMARPAITMTPQLVESLWIGIGTSTRAIESVSGVPHACKGCSLVKLC